MTKRRQYKFNNDILFFKKKVALDLWYVQMYGTNRECISGDFELVVEMSINTVPISERPQTEVLW
jgi:hypothetical protein